MQRNILIHPALNHAQDIKDICSPLQLLNIQYFSHVHIDKNGKFSGIGNGPGFAEHYLKNKYYNADIHMAKQHKFGSFVIWDELERSGQSAKMHLEAAQFGIQHTFTIIENTENDGSHFYHFANNSSSKTINQTYLTNLDLLQLFNKHFREKVNETKSLRRAYELKFELDPDTEGYTIKDDATLKLSEKNRGSFEKLFSNYKTANSADPIFQQINNKCLAIDSLTKRENECLYLLLHGKTVKEIGAILSISARTAEIYIANSKIKLQVRTKSQLIQKIIELSS